MNGEKMNSQERIMAIVELLAKAGRSGHTSKEIVFAVQSTASNVCRDLALLEKRGWVERRPSGTGWRLTPFFGGFSNLIARSFREAKLRLTEDEDRYSSAMQ